MGGVHSGAKRVLVSAGSSAMGASGSLGSDQSDAGRILCVARAPCAQNGSMYTACSLTRGDEKDVFIPPWSGVAGGMGGASVGLVRAPQVHFLLNSFEDGHGCFLPPPGTAPHVVANVLKAFFSTLPEPLLTYKCARPPSLLPPSCTPPAHPAVQSYRPTGLSDLLHTESELPRHSK